VQVERNSLPADAELVPAKLDDAIVAAVRDIVRRHGKRIRRAYLLRRVLKSDPTIMDYVLAFETGRLTLTNKGPETVKLLVQEEFPVPMFVVHLGSSPYTRFRKHIARQQIEPLTL
jgi:hypothetical protein